MATKVFIVISIFILILLPISQAAAEINERSPVYLSDLSLTYPPFYLTRTLTDVIGYFQCDRSLAEVGQINIHGMRKGAPISIQGQTYKKGLGTMTPSVFTYDLAGKYSSFHTIIGTDDSEKKPQNFSFEVYLDDVKVGTWHIDKNKAVKINIDTTDAQELVMVATGPPGMMINLAGARLIPASSLIKPAKINATNRKNIFQLDDQLVTDCEVLLLARSAMKIDSIIGPDSTAINLGGYGKTTSTRGADLWAAIKDKGDLLRWQALIQRPGQYQIWTRVVSANPNQKPNPKDYIVSIDGKPLDCEIKPQLIIERTPNDRFTNHLWGYLYSPISLESGLHTVEVENAKGTFLAVDRVVLVREGTVAESLLPTTPIKPVSAPQDFNVSCRFEPKKMAGFDFISVDDGRFFSRAKELGLKFVPSFTYFLPVLGENLTDLGKPTKESVKKMLESNLPFTIHVRFNKEYDKPLLDKQTYQDMKDAAGDRWQGFWSSEWSDNYMLFSPEANSLPKPETRKEAYKRVKTWYKRMASKCHNDILPQCATWHWDHYTAEWANVTGFEGEPGISPEAHLRIWFTRGAARQYEKFWSSYIAPPTHDARGVMTFNTYIISDDFPYDTRMNATTGGSSVSWLKRMFYMTYMWGTTVLKNESPAYETNFTADGKIAPSPMGEAAAEFYEFAATHKNRGRCYTPVGIMLDYMNGWSGRLMYPDRYLPLIWGCLQPEASDYMKDAIFQLIYPGQFDELNEWSVLSNTPYGDIFDLMISSATLQHIQAYPVIFLVGDVAADMNDTLASKLENYVRNGGTLVINTKQITPAFPEDLLGVKITDKTEQADCAKCDLDNHRIKGQTFSYHLVELKKATPIISTSDGKPLATRNQVDKGVVILTTTPFLLQENLNGVCFLPHLMEHLISGLLPFKVDGDIEYIANRNEDSWLVTLINNRGVYKLPNEYATFDPRQTQTVNITLDKKPAKIADWKNAEPIQAKKIDNNWRVTVDIPPGDLKILQIKD